MSPVEFLMKVWGIQCKPGHFVAVSSKGGDKWKDYTFPYDEHLTDKLENWLENNQEKDLYFCPLSFTGPRRRADLVAPSKFLWLDIDEGSVTKCPPSVLWLTSPGRYSGLWELPKMTDPEEASLSSKKMTQFINGDPGGWDLTQVLRIPGTLNYKYDPPPTVTLKHFTRTILKSVPENALGKWRSVIPRKLLRIIEGNAEVGKRSEMLWSLEHELCDLGIPIADSIAILKDSDWNKYRGRADEDERFSVEMEKIIGDRQEKQVETREEPLILRVESYSDLMSSMSSTPGWMVRDWWMRASHGIIAGEPKSFKSTLNMDLLFSIASTQPFLGQFPVEFGGPVIVVQNENADWMQKDRLEKIALSRGEVGKVKTSDGRLKIQWARDLEMFFVNQQGFTLDDAANKAALEELIDRYRPAALVLDPLYLMFSGDVNSAKELYPVLQWCLYLKQEYKVAVMLIHHYNKGGDANKRGGQRMLGSTTLHGWIESAWYLQTQEPRDGKAVISIDREFRGASMYGKVDLELEMGDFGDPLYNTRLVEHTASAEDHETTIINCLATSTDALSKSHIAKSAALSRYLVDKLVDAMVSKGTLIRKGERYVLGNLD